MNIRHTWNRFDTHRLKPSKGTLIRAGLTAIAILGVILIIRAHSPRRGSVPFTKEYSVSLIDYNGKSVRFETFKQKNLIVFFWATWCPYCKAELTHLGELKAEYGDKLQIIAVNRGESLAEAKAYSDALMLPPGVTFLLDSNDGLFKQLKGYAVPETIFVNSRAEEVKHQHGPMKPPEVDAAVSKLFE